MLVKDLIEKLKEFDEESTVMLRTSYYDDFGWDHAEMELADVHSSKFAPDKNAVYIG